MSVIDFFFYVLAGYIFWSFISDSITGSTDVIQNHFEFAVHNNLTLPDLFGKLLVDRLFEFFLNLALLVLLLILLASAKIRHKTRFLSAVSRAYRRDVGRHRLSAEHNHHLLSRHERTFSCRHALHILLLRVTGILECYRLRGRGPCLSRAVQSRGLIQSRGLLSFVAAADFSVLRP